MEPEYHSSDSPGYIVHPKTFTQAFPKLGHKWAAKAEFWRINRVEVKHLKKAKILNWSKTKMKNLSLFSLHVLAKQVKILKAEQYFLRRKEANLTLRVSGLWLLQVIS